MRKKCLIVFLFVVVAGTSFAAEKIWLGADVSWLPTMQAKGMQWHDGTGNQIDPYPWLKSEGLRALRFRLWVDAKNKENGIEDVIAKAKRAEQFGFQWMLDFHFSDTWADPGNQQIPASWTVHSKEALANELATHVTESLAALKKANVTPTWIQIGNEVNHGFLWPEAHTENNLDTFVYLYRIAANAARNALPSAKLILHIADCSEIGAYYYLLPPLLKANAIVDIIGVSAYAYWSPKKTYELYHQQCANNLNKLKVAFNREVMVVEFGALWLDQNAAKLTQQFFEQMRTVKQESLGVFYWEPMASPAKNYGLGAFSPEGTQMPLWDTFVDGAR